MIGLLYVAYKNVEFLLNRDMATSNDVTIGIAAVAIVHHILHEVGTIPVMSFRLEMIDTNYIQALVSVFTATFTHATWSHLVANISVLMLCQRSLSANKWSSPLLLVILFFGGSLSGFALNVYCVMLHNWEMDRKTEQVRKIVGVCNNWFCNMIQWNRSLRPVIVNSMVKVGNWHDILTMMAYKSNDRVGASAGVYSIAAAHTVSSFAIIIMKIFSNLAGRSSESDASRDSDGNSNSNSNRNGKKPSSSSSSSSSGISTRTSGGDADGPPPSDVSSRGDKGATRYRGTRRYTIIDMIRPRKGTIVELVPYLKDNSWWFVIQLKTVLRFLFFVVKVLDIMNGKWVCNVASINLQTSCSIIMMMMLVMMMATVMVMVIVIIIIIIIIIIICIGHSSPTCSTYD
jgi:hypothetical protein